MYKVINPNIMNEKYKKDDFRDWIIFREYVNQLEYMTEVVGIIHNNIQAQKEKLFRFRLESDWRTEEDWGETDTMHFTVFCTDIKYTIAI